MAITGNVSSDAHRQHAKGFGEVPRAIDTNLGDHLKRTQAIVADIPATNEERANHIIQAVPDLNMNPAQRTAIHKIIKQAVDNERPKPRAAQVHNHHIATVMAKQRADQIVDGLKLTSKPAVALSSAAAQIDAANKAVLVRTSTLIAASNRAQIERDEIDDLAPGKDRKAQAIGTHSKMNFDSKHDHSKAIRRESVAAYRIYYGPLGEDPRPDLHSLLFRLSKTPHYH